MIPANVNPLLMAGNADPLDEYMVIGNSVRFNQADSAYFSRTPGGAGNRQKFTFSAWVKLSKLSGQRGVFAAGTSTSDDQAIRFNGDIIDFFYWTGSYVWRVDTVQIRRDSSAHMHIVVAVDTTQAVAAARVKIYANGIECSYGSATYPTLNENLNFSNATAHRIGSQSTTDYFDGYLSDAHFIDGQALDPSYFGATHPKTNQWRPKAYAGTYGTNGFHLDFSDGSAATAGVLGADRSGNGNNWTPTNISVAAGVGQDWQTDTPTNNYATIDRLWPHPSGITISNGNLDVTTTPGANNETVVCAPIPTEDVALYWEQTQVGGSGMLVGIGRNLVPADLSTDIKTGQGWLVGNGNKFNNGTTAYGSAFATNEVAMVAYKRTGNAWSIWVGKQGAWFASGDPVAGTNPTFTGTWSAGDQIYPVIVDEWTSSNISAAINFGQRTFAYAAPAGFKTLGTKNYSQTSTVTVSGTFTGNASADGPRVDMNGAPETLTINGNAVTFGTHADRLANGFKLRTSSASYNTAGANTWTATIVSNIKNIFRNQNARGN